MPSAYQNAWNSEHLENICGLLKCVCLGSNGSTAVTICMPPFLHISFQEKKYDWIFYVVFTGQNSQETHRPLGHLQLVFLWTRKPAIISLYEWYITSVTNLCVSTNLGWCFLSPASIQVPSDHQWTCIQHSSCAGNCAKCWYQKHSVSDWKMSPRQEQKFAKGCVREIGEWWICPQFWLWSMFLWYWQI